MSVTCPTVEDGAVYYACIWYLGSSASVIGVGWQALFFVFVPLCDIKYIITSHPQLFPYEYRQRKVRGEKVANGGREKVGKKGKTEKRKIRQRYRAA